MSLRQPLDLVRNAKRPALRVQLTMLYSCLFLGVLAAVLLATNVLYGHTAARAPNGVTTAAPVDGTQTFDFGPALLGLAAAAVALAGAWWLAGRFLRPLHAITATAQEISATNLNRRLALTGPNDELTALGRTLDDLFGRLESSFEAQRQFVANASHELRTPLAGQRTLLQVALADPGADTASLRAICEEALRLGDQQEKLIDALLTLATSERGIERWETFDLAEITQGVLGGRRDEAEHLDLLIDATLVAAPAVGDPRLVELLVANLVDNALRHNHSGGRVEISTISPPGRAAITVTNTGPTVSADQVERLFQPFQQPGPQRVHHNDGHGLGLAIVAAIARAHHATITAAPHPHCGIEISVTFPSAPATPGESVTPRS